ncbi:hypothetical protein Tco_0159147, partial [Tanacetum coccineum]
TDKSKITRKQSKNKQARTRESEEYKAEARKAKPQSKSAKVRKDNGENIMKSINEGPFHMGTVSDVIAGGTEGAVQQGPVRARVLNDLSAEEKERYKADIRATNILLQGIPKDIYSLINHYTDAKDIWENVKMILEGSELTKDDRESQLYDEFEHFCQNKGETIQGYYVRFTKLINDMRNIKMTMPRMQLNSKFVNNMLPEWSRFITEVKLNRGLKESNFDQLYAYLKQHEQYPTQSSKSPQPSNEPSPADKFQLDSGSSSTENLIESLSNSLTLLTQSYKSYQLFFKALQQSIISATLTILYIKSYSFSLFSSLPGVLTPVRGESLKILNGFDVSLPVSHSLWSSQSFGHQKGGKSNPLSPRNGKFHGD